MLDDARAATAFGWAATISGVVQMLLPKQMVANVSPEVVASYVLTGASAITAITGALIVAYQRYRAERRNQALEDEKAFRESAEGKLALLRDQLKIANAERATLRREVASLSRQAAILTSQIQLVKCPLVERGGLPCPDADEAESVRDAIRSKTPVAKDGGGDQSTMG